MAAGHAFLTQVSSRAWKCSECPLMFTAEDATALDRMLNRFVHHVRKMHAEGETETPQWKPRRRRRIGSNDMEPPAIS